MLELPLHVGMEHPDFLWILVALLAGFAIGLLVGAVVANRRPSVWGDPTSTEE